LLINYPAPAEVEVRAYRNKISKWINVLTELTSFKVREAAIKSIHKELKTYCTDLKVDHCNVVELFQVIPNNSEITIQDALEKGLVFFINDPGKLSCQDPKVTVTSKCFIAQNV